MAMGMCPHCGVISRLKLSLTPIHGYEDETGYRTCPGSQQNPRNAESDGRVLWNGKPNLYFKG